MLGRFPPKKKRSLARWYENEFAGIEGIRIFKEPEGSKSNYWLNLLLLDTASSALRESIIQDLNDNRIGVRPAWVPLHQLPMYQDCPKSNLDQPEDLAKRLICLPSTPALWNQLSKSQTITASGDR